MSAGPGPGRRVVFAYAAGHVRRWHAFGHIIRQQNVLEHSGGVVLWITLLHPDPSANLLKAAAVHDLGEIVTGDMPGNMKRKYEELGTLLNKVEGEVLLKYGLNNELSLNPEEKHWIDSADVFDAWMFLLHNLLADNHMAQGDFNKAFKTMEQWNKEGKCPDEIIIACRQVRTFYPWIKLY